MTPWWETWEGRLEAELDSFRRHGLVFAQDERAIEMGRLVLHGSIDVDGEVIDLDVMYPDSYPWTRFAVRAPGLTLPRHQHPFGKNLCVFPRASEHWRRDFLAGDIVADRVPGLVRLVRAGGEELTTAEDPQGEPFTDYYTYYPFGALLVPPEIRQAAVEHDGGEFVARMLTSADWLEVSTSRIKVMEAAVGQALVTSLKRNGAIVAKADDRLVSAARGPAWTGHWVRVPAPPQAPDGGAVVDLVSQAHPNLAPSRLRYDNGRAGGFALLGLVFKEEVRQGEYEDAWLFVLLARQGGKKRHGVLQRGEGVSAVLLRGLRCGIEDLQERIPELEVLRTSTVSLIGAGTLGSPLVKELARNCTKELRLLDPDFMDSPTSVRWERGFSAAGVAKVAALRHAWSIDYPFTNIYAFGSAVGATALTGDEGGDRELFQEWAGDASLIIDATAEDNVTGAVSAFAWQEHIPFLAVWSIEGVGGVVVRLINGETGCFHCLELHLSPEHGGIPVPSPPTDPRRVQPKGCADPTFISPAPDLLPLVDQASRMAFGELCSEKKSGGYPRYMNDLYVLFIRDADGQLVDPLRWEAHRLPVHPKCPLHEEG